MWTVILFLMFLASEASGNLTNPSQMTFPLFFSAANSSRHRRELRTTSSARMRLHDDLVTEGYYSTRLYIGTPPQEFTLIVDTGSTVTYVPCSTCENCGNNHQDPRFQPEKSSTYVPVKCTSGCDGCDSKKNQCRYSRNYAESSSSSGVLGKDIVSFGKESVLKPQYVVFGCENSETGQLYSQDADGIIGLGRAPLSIMDQLVNKHVIDDSFSLCYGGMDLGGGVMVLGDVPPPSGMVFTHSNHRRSRYYNLELKNILVSGESLHLNHEEFEHQDGTILDSGTTFAYIPESAFQAFKKSIIEKLHSPKQIPGPDPHNRDVCFSGFGSEVSQLSEVFPDVDIVFNDGQKIKLSPENYLFRHSKLQGAYCLGIFSNKKYGTTLLGGIIVRNTLVTYDRKNDRIGFWKTNCSQLWETARSSGVPPASPEKWNSTTRATAPPPSEKRNSTTESSPGPSPGELQHFNFSGEFPIAFIRVGIYLNMNYSDLVPIVTELGDAMASSLKVNASQIELSSFKSEGNGSFIRWIILPETYADRISNKTAMAIIFHLTGDNFHLPEKFGSFKLVELRLEPLIRRTWWQRHALTLILGASAVAILASSILLLSYWYRRKHGAHLYRPVDAPAPAPAPLKDLQLP